MQRAELNQTYKPISIPCLLMIVALQGSQPANKALATAQKIVHEQLGHVEAYHRRSSHQLTELLTTLQQLRAQQHHTI